MGFDKDKENALSKQDKSKKQSIDHGIKLLVDLLNSKMDFYTTSSCAGRILLISNLEVNRKYNAEWFFISHDIVRFDDIKLCLAGIDDGDVDLKQESAIFHVCCRTLESASELIEMAKHIGFKRSGISTISNKIMVEIVSTELVCAPVIKDGKIVVSDDYLRILVSEANKKMVKTKEKIERFTQQLL
ncbi:MAG: tRNA wybutosine-synthesizing 3 family protein [Nanoarchaeota archaeon]